MNTSSWRARDGSERTRERFPRAHRVSRTTHARARRPIRRVILASTRAFALPFPTRARDDEDARGRRRARTRTRKRAREGGDDVDVGARDG